MSLDPDNQWDVVESDINKILAVKKVLTRKKRPLGITQEIFRAKHE